MRKSRFSEAQIIGMIKEQEAGMLTAEGLCCTNPMRDSSRESSVVAGVHEQTFPLVLQDQELASLQ